VTETCSLSDLGRGTPARVVEIEPAQAQRLAALGLRRGKLLSVEQDAPFSGPRIVRLGTVRLALARAVTRAITVRPDAGLDGPGK
jgi:Fe2+ transport system protein FeoA